MFCLFISLSILMNLYFFMVTNPLTLGLLLILQVLSLSIMMGFMNFSFWFFYMIILIFIGGMLVLFMYVTSIFPNQKFLFNQHLFFTLLLTTTFLIMIFMINKYFFLNLNLNNFNMMFLMKPDFSLIDTSKIFFYKNNFLLIFMVNYLFYCMIIVVKMTNVFQGPLRKMNYV